MQEGVQHSPLNSSASFIYIPFVIISICLRVALLSRILQPLLLLLRLMRMTKNYYYYHSNLLHFVLDGNNNNKLNDEGREAPTERV